MNGLEPKTPNYLLKMQPWRNNVRNYLIWIYYVAQLLYSIIAERSFAYFMQLFSKFLFDKFHSCIFFLINKTGTIYFTGTVLLCQVKSSKKNYYRSYILLIKKRKQMLTQVAYNTTSISATKNVWLDCHEMNTSRCVNYK